MIKPAAYAVKIDFFMAPLLFSQLYCSLPRSRKRKIDFYLRQQDKLTALTAGLLLTYSLESVLGYPLQEDDWLVDGWGKPFLKEYPVHFNLSHAGEWAVCVLADCPIGIDIEQVTPIDFVEVARSFFTVSEYHQLTTLPPEDQLPHFYHLWTLKESLGKAVGKGLSLYISQTDFTGSTISEPIKICLPSDDHNQTWYCKTYPFHSGYKLSICSLVNVFPQDITIIPLSTICRHIKK